ncbi:MAG: ATP phosphoribosyltransferase regulatory subunit [Pseudomonadales bacterium]|jgi:ATP phosphoribosyltransferase regulatory subunit|nr:ATP phosphoribosyltransferase regulatory subunit [Pseudomonadales bacterium]MDP4640798.1 ATP phosphoribosyltransferase regulatory subunit [Pseudomonadales bacterium]MDP4765843.1 ATP phosphoribosyltransferase regulatory subunit [Pseudomonadales bacterium]MDP4875041.1 ATP phosphoribosyltransferase regulatory subunit [Pseudomonadales bacterium]MDP4912742.1 ATP phosphoribosyltransferase regulatory subunit [Pseudomonadales bacterium]
MNIADRWLLPDGVDEVLPPAASNLERIRRELLDIFVAWGYDYVIPPMVEFLESLLTGTGSDLDLKTFKVTDQISGRMMGIRADITSQVARIDAHSQNKEGVARFCYSGTVLHARPENMLASRAPIHVGAELFGESGSDADLEIVSLMIESMQALGLTVMVELGDVGIFRQLVQRLAISAADEELLFALIQKKAAVELEAKVKGLALADEHKQLILALPGLCGTEGVLARGQQLFATFPDIVQRLANIADVARGVESRFPGLQIYYDLSELRGYNYHTGIVFAAYLGDARRRVAQGGRYDSIGRLFGRDRGATGFDVDLKTLGKFVTLADVPRPVVIAAAGAGIADQQRWQKIRELRAAGYIVVESGLQTVAHDFTLNQDGGEWQLTKTN